MMYLWSMRRGKASSISDRFRGVDSVQYRTGGVSGGMLLL